MTKRTYFLAEDLENQRKFAALLVQFGLNTREEYWSLATRNPVPYSLTGVVADYARAYSAAMKNEMVNMELVISSIFLRMRFNDFYPICVSSKTGEVDVEQTVVWINSPDHSWSRKLPFGETVYYLVSPGQVLRFLGGQTPMAKLRDFLIANYDSPKLQKVCADLDIDPGRNVFGRGASPSLVVETVLEYVETETKLRKQFVQKVKAAWRDQAMNVPDWK